MSKEDSTLSIFDLSINDCNGAPRYSILDLYLLFWSIISFSRGEQHKEISQHGLQ